MIRSRQLARAAAASLAPALAAQAARPALEHAAGTKQVGAERAPAAAGAERRVPEQSAPALPEARPEPVHRRHPPS
jgi:hypothetical protein